MVEVAKIDGHDEKRDRSTSTVHFAMQTSIDKYLSFPLQKMAGPTQIDGCMKGRFRSTSKSMSRSRIAHGVQKRRFGSKMNGTWKVDIKYSFDYTTEKTPEV